MVADYYGETNNAINYGSIYAWKALGGSFAGGGRRPDHDRHAVRDRDLPLGARVLLRRRARLASRAVVTFFCKAPTVQQMEAAVRATEEKEAQKAKPVTA